MSSNQPNQLREEGIEARNFVSWRVPKTVSKDILETPTNNNKSDKATVPNTFNSDTNANTNNATSSSSAVNSRYKFLSLTTSTPPTNVSQASMRLWKLIFQNICRSVDELYIFCEEEQNAELCEQSFQFFLTSCRDFAQLAQKFEKNEILSTTDKVFQLYVLLKNDIIIILFYSLYCYLITMYLY